MENKTEETKDTELFMLAQFIDVMDIIEKYDNIEDVKEDIKKRKKAYLDIIKSKEPQNDFFSLSLDENIIEEKIQKGKKIYSGNNEYNEAHLVYKIGLIDGMKIS